MEHNQSDSILWRLFLPAFVIGSSLLAASAAVYKWMDFGTLITILVLLPIPMYLLLERLMPKRKDWLLNWHDFAEDAFWVLATAFIWIPLYDGNYKTPISNIFKSIREQSSFPFTLQADSIIGLLVAALIGIVMIEFISYWLHRLQHRFIFFWRIHATHHHINKMSVGRTDRTHPLEFLGLYLGSAITLAFFGASAQVVGVVVVIRTAIAYSAHANLPMKSGVFGWFFNTPEWHQLHHSCNYAESNTNYGCTLIIWDRIFGTFSGKTGIEKVGNGTGDKLSLISQLTLPFRSNSAIRKL